MTVDTYGGFGSWKPSSIPPFDINASNPVSSFVSPALSFTVHATEGPARCSTLKLPHDSVPTPIFMPVGTQGTIKGLTASEMEELDCHILLANTYFMNLRPGPDVLEQQGGLHQLMSWKRNILTDSGGFQMVSLLSLSQLTEEGVTFSSPVDNSSTLLTPERSIQIQHAIGSDIMMMLDDVVDVKVKDRNRMEEAMYRSIRWLDRALVVHKNSGKESVQNLFGIVQGGLDDELRRISVQLTVDRKLPGFAIGGLSGGEAKEDFCRVVALCCKLLPQNQPRYLMGVGYALDLVVASALGVDMFDCVFPTRTARFGTALVPFGQLQIRKSEYKSDFSPLDANCDCFCCKRYTRAALHALYNRDSTLPTLLSIHNIAFQLRLMKCVRAAIYSNNLALFCREFLKTQFKTVADSPKWAVDALLAAGYCLDD
ncbi:hypothetical protein RCL1_005952 [Eukaryota sp. TZLM3-RCL]